MIKGEESFDPGTFLADQKCWPGVQERYCFDSRLWLESNLHDQEDSDSHRVLDHRGCSIGSLLAGVLTCSKKQSLGQTCSLGPKLNLGPWGVSVTLFWREGKCLIESLLLGLFFYSATSRNGLCQGDRDDVCRPPLLPGWLLCLPELLVTI